MSADAAIATLTEGAELRTWSLIVTIFGDLARAPGAEIPGPVLSAITGRIGVKPEAMRVALHRLRKEDWLASRREGRVSHYLLTEAGRAESEKATGRIYATSPTEPEKWHLLVAGPIAPAQRLEADGALAAKGYVTLMPGIWLGHGPAPDRFRDFLAFEGTPARLPDWLRLELMPDALADAYADFARTLKATTEALGTAKLTALDSAALRVLIVHRWRRLVLRHPDLPDAFFPEGWAGPKARRQVHALLAHLGRPAIDDIAEAALVSRLDAPAPRG